LGLGPLVFFNCEDNIGWRLIVVGERLSGDNEGAWPRFNLYVLGRRMRKEGSELWEGSVHADFLGLAQLGVRLIKNEEWLIDLA